MYAFSITHCSGLLPGRTGVQARVNVKRATLLRTVLSVAALLALALPARVLLAQNESDGDLPDAPSALLMAALEQQQPAETPCPPASAGEPTAACAQHAPGRVQPIISHYTAPLTPEEKARLAVKDLTDPFNIFAVTAYSGISIAINPHSAYGPGLKGWGKLTGYSFMEDAQGEFFGTFLIPVIVHEDPRYRRLPHHPIMQRTFHAIEHTFVAEHDDGRPMPNYATLFTYPISAELSNLYVPGVQTDGKSTAIRIGIGIASDPISNLVNEFLPDIASHIHIHVLFFQEILNRVATGQQSPLAISVHGPGPSGDGDDVRGH